MASPTLFTYQKCLMALRSAKNDSEKMAALFAISKILNSQNKYEVSLEDIFIATSASFLRRLINTESVPDSCPQFVYKSVACSVMSRLATSAKVRASKEFLGLLPDINQVILIPRVEETENEVVQVIIDCYDIYNCFADDENLLHVLISHRTITALCEAIAQKTLCWGKAQQLLLHIMRIKKKETWLNNMDGLGLWLLHQVAQLLSVKREEDKFVLLGLIYDVCCSVSKEQFEPMTKNLWTKQLQNVLFLTLQKKLVPQRRELVLKLAAILIDLFGIDWAMNVDENKFLLVVVNLCCIEVRVVLDQGIMEKAEANGELLVACFALMENMVSYLSSEDNMTLTQNHVSQSYLTLKSAFSTIMAFLKEIEEQENDKRLWPMSLACIRVLGSWIAEETIGLTDQLMSILPFILQIAKETFLLFSGAPAPPDSLPYQHPSPAQPTECRLDTDPDQHERIVNSREEIVHFILPGLCNLSSDEKARKILLNEGIVSLMIDYFKYQYKTITDELDERVMRNFNAPVGSQESTKESVAFIEAKSAVNLTCGVLLNFTVMEFGEIRTDPVFTSFVTTTIHNLPTIANQGDLCVIVFNLMSIALMAIRNQKEKDVATQQDLYHFYQTTIHLLFCHIGSDRQTVQDGTLSVQAPLHTRWDELQELWFLSMQALGVCIIKFPRASAILLQSNVLEETLQVLLTADKTRDELTISGYSTVLQHLGRLPHGKVELLKYDGLRVAQHLGLQELKTILTS